MFDKKRARVALVILFLINMLNFFDRLIIGAVGEPIRVEFGLNDASLGLLSTAFALLYAFVGVPFGRLADKKPRNRILAAGLFVWSLLTAASGIAQNFWQIFLLRLGVGVGEASCAPAATSLIADLFPPEKRTRALSIFMLGLPVGIALSFAVSGAVAQAWGWRAAFFVAGVPGILLAAAVLFLIKEPKRGGSESTAVGERIREGSPYRLILSMPTMRWLIISGAIHNFCLYALSSFMMPYLMRYHGLGLRDASLIAMAVNGIFTLPGLLLSGFLGDAANERRPNGGLMIVAVAVLLAIPAMYLAISAEPGNSGAFLMFMGLGFLLMYFYYSIVYSAIADVTEPALRGTAMSLYFMAMYVLGGALGPYVVGLISDHFTRKAASAAGITEMSAAALEPFRTAGLHSAMYIIPVFCAALAAVMFFAARRMPDDLRRLREWVNEGSGPPADSAES